MRKHGPSPLALTIPDDVRPELEALARSTTLAHTLVERARIVLACAEGRSTEFVARMIGCESRNVRKWKARFRKSPTVASLGDLPRSGRPARISLANRCELVALACERPEENFAPFRDVWTHKALSEAMMAKHNVAISVSEVGRVLQFNLLRPHLVRYWLTSKDPDFAAKAERVCDLYLKPPPGAVVYCVDEKPIQVVGHKYPMEIGPRAVNRKEYEYVRHGTCCLLAAFDTATGRVVAEVVDHRTADATVAFVDKLAALHPDQEVYIVWDNLNTHLDGPNKRWTALNDKHRKRLHFVHTPIHASWLNQVEIFFSILERRILKHADFDGVPQAVARIMDYIHHWTTKLAHPFRWTWRYIKPEDRQRKVA
jgi:transposase